MHICMGNLTIIGSDNGLSPGQYQAIIWINDGILLIIPLGTNFSEFFIKILTFSLKKMHLKVLSAKWRPFCLGLNVLRTSTQNITSPEGGQDTSALHKVKIKTLTLGKSTEHDHNLIEIWRWSDYVSMPNSMKFLCILKIMQGNLCDQQTYIHMDRQTEYWMDRWKLDEWTFIK